MERNNEEPFRLLMSTMPKFPGPSPKQQILLEAWQMAAPRVNVHPPMVDWFAKEEVFQLMPGGR